MLHRRKILGLSLFLFTCLPLVVSSASGGDGCGCRTGRARRASAWWLLWAMPFWCLWRARRVVD